MLIMILCNKLLLDRATSQLASCSEPSRAELARSFHEPQKQVRLGLVLSVEPVRSELSCCEPESARRARAFFPALVGRHLETGLGLPYIYEGYDRLWTLTIERQSIYLPFFTFCPSSRQ
jgi:hypothetical protein